MRRIRLCSHPRCGAPPLHRMYWLLKLLERLEAPTITAAEAPRTTAKTITPEDTLRVAGGRGERQARYQRRMSSLLAGRG